MSEKRSWEMFRLNNKIFLISLISFILVFPVLQNVTYGLDEEKAEIFKKEVILLRTKQDISELINRFLTLKAASPQKRGEFETKEEYLQRSVSYKKECKDKYTILISKQYKVEYKYSDGYPQSFSEFDLRQAA